MGMILAARSAPWGSNSELLRTDSNCENWELSAKSYGNVNYGRIVSQQCLNATTPSLVIAI